MKSDSSKLLRASFLFATLLVLFLFNSTALTGFASSLNSSSVSAPSYQSPSAIRNVSSTTRAGWVGSVKTGSIMRIHARLTLPPITCNANQSKEQSAYFYILARGKGIDIKGGVEAYCLSGRSLLYAVAYFNPTPKNSTPVPNHSGGWIFAQLEINASQSSTEYININDTDNLVVVCVGTTDLCQGAPIDLTEANPNLIVTVGWLLSTCTNTCGVLPQFGGKAVFSACHFENAATETWHSPSMLGQLAHYTLANSHGKRLAIAGKLNGTPKNEDFFVKQLTSS